MHLKKSTFEQNNSLRNKFEFSLSINSIQFNSVGFRFVPYRIHMHSQLFSPFIQNSKIIYHIYYNLIEIELKIEQIGFCFIHFL